MNVLVQVWKDCKRPIDYFFALWIYILFGMFFLGMAQILYAMITGQIDYDSIRFGLFDNPI